MVPSSAAAAPVRWEVEQNGCLSLRKVATSRLDPPGRVTRPLRRRRKVDAWPSFPTRKPFEIAKDFSPRGDQANAIDGLLEGLDSGYRFQTLLGATGTGKTYTMASAIARSGRPALVLAHNKTLAAQLCQEFRAFFPENSVQYFISYYDYYQPEAYVPSADLYIEKDSSDERPRSSGCGTRRPRRSSPSESATWSWSPR